MDKKELDKDIGTVITDGRTKTKSTVLLSEAGLDSDIKESIVLPNDSSVAERIVRYGSNKAEDEKTSIV